MFLWKDKKMSQEERIGKARGKYGISMSGSVCLCKGLHL